MTAVVDRLSAVVSRPVGYRTRPPGAAAAGWQYLIVYPVGEQLTGSTGRPFDDADYLVQIQCVAQDGVAVDWLRGRVESALLGSPLTAGDREVYGSFVEGGTSGDEQDTGLPRLFFSTPRFRFRSLSVNTT